MAAEIRPYRPADRAALYDVCVRTAEAGGDARGLYYSDDLVPDVFAGPYAELEPGLAFVLDDGGTVGAFETGALIACEVWDSVMTSLCPSS